MAEGSEAYSTSYSDSDFPMADLSNRENDSDFREDSGADDHGSPTENELEELGHEIAEKWMKLGRRLGVKDPKLQDIEQRYEQLCEKGYQMLIHWKQGYGSAATYQTLNAALQHKSVQRKDLAEKICCKNGGKLNIHVAVEDLKPKEPDTEGSVSHSGREDPHALRALSLIAMNYLQTTPPQSSEERTEFKEYLREMKVIITGVYVGSLMITVKCDSLQILEKLWADYSCGRLGSMVQSCFVTEKILKELNLAELKLKTTMDIEEYNARKVYFERVALRGVECSRLVRQCNIDRIRLTWELQAMMESAKYMLEQLVATFCEYFLPMNSLGSHSHFISSEDQAHLESWKQKTEVGESDVMKADREDGEIQLEGEGEESDEQDEEVENEGESLYNEIAASEEPAAEDSEENELSFKRFGMAEGGNERYPTSDSDSDISIFDSENSEDEEDDGEELSDREDAEIQLEGEGKESDEKDGEVENEEALLYNETLEQLAVEENKQDQNDPKLPLTVNRIIDCVRNSFYGHRVRPQYINILTDFVDAEIFLIDGDSLLLELLCENSLDWQHGGEFLHLTYLVERFLKFFTDKGGVFRVIFFKDLEIIWRSRPSMLLARQALILHLQNNTRFTVVTSVSNFWHEGWSDYIDNSTPAFLMLTDAENIPWKEARETRELDLAVEYFFRCLLLHSLGQRLNCVFISGIDMTATKVMGDFVESTSIHRTYFMQIDVKSEIRAALQSPPQGGCRELATVLTCAQVLCKLLRDNDSCEETVKIAQDRVKLFLLHAALLRKLSLKYRAHRTLLNEFCEENDGKVFPFDEIYTGLWKILKLVQIALEDAHRDESVKISLDMSSVADLVDGRLVHVLFFCLAKQTSKNSEELGLPEDVIGEAECAWRKVVTLANGSRHSNLLESQFFPMFDGIATGLHRVEEGNSDDDACLQLRKLLEVDSALVNEYAGEIRSRINAMAGDEAENEVFNSGKEFDELYHWHTLKPLTDDFERTKQQFKDKPPTDPRERKSYFINKMKHVRYHRLYGNSLVGGVDNAKIITVTEDGSRKKNGKHKDLKMGKKKKQIIEENERRIQGQLKEKDEEKWQHFKKEIASNLKKDNHDTVLQLVDKYLADGKSPDLRLYALMEKAKTCMAAWQHTRTLDPESNDLKYPVLLMESVQKMAYGYQDLLTVEYKKKLSGFMQKLGFSDIASMFYHRAEERERKTKELYVHSSSVRFQLEHMGHLLKKAERTDPDPRVDHFIPDTWQRELLNAVDKNESAIVVAPTSSGKTYASYYCMEKVLRQDNDGVVVYVSPTKALVNQVVATVYARFHRKQLPEGRAVYGVFTRDYRFNTLNSQILVTVPQCLEILFLSPRRQDWTKNVKYVIFDEVHCLGQEIGAEVWEHLLLLIRCPFLALSATIGNPNDLMEWLQAAQDFREQQDKLQNVKLRASYKIRLVTCPERYSDLEKSIYLPSPSNGEFSSESQKYEGTYDLKGTEEFVRLHPCAQLGFKQLRENSFPGDMALTPRETLQLYDVMVQQWPEKESLQKLFPEKYFLGTELIQKDHVRQYESEVKAEFKSWADEGQVEKVKSVIRWLNKECLQTGFSTEEEWNKLEMDSSGTRFILNNFTKLVDQLRAQNKLPALVFSFDRQLCEVLAGDLTLQLEKREMDLKARAGLKSAKGLEKKQAKAEKRAKRRRDKAEKRKGKSGVSGHTEEQDETEFSVLNRPPRDLHETELAVKHGITHEVAKGDLNKIMSRIQKHAEKTQGTADKKNIKRLMNEGEDQDEEDLDKPLPECTLGFRHGIGNEELNKIMSRIWSMHSRNPFKRGLKRGISYHHAGLNNKMRSVVEMLFRERYLQVVTATGTLALGIHMPCKTVVFAGDSPFLNSLQYRQMSGRAGRRGFDPVGNVVFFGLPYRKVQRLITANIPKLVGNFPINVSLVLRLLLMTSKGDDPQDALTKGLVKIENGAPQEMAGLAAHLHYHEPSNYILVSFLRRGLFHKFCEPGTNDEFSQDVMRKMVLVISHLIGRRFLHPSLMRRISKCSASKVILEPLPEDFAEALSDYNRQVTNIFSQYLATVAKDLEKESGEDIKLPLSGIEFPGKVSIAEEDLDKYHALKILANTSIPYSACSSFAALSGNTDEQLHSSKSASAETQESEDDEEEPIEHLLKIVRQDVYTDVNVVPTLSVSGSRRLNAYALDFFKHGSSKVIERDNGIKSGEVFTALKDFYLTIKSISTSLEEMGPENDNVVRAFKQLAREYGEKFNKRFNSDI
ncbi:putative ATP-dependent RNA helicase DDX60 [Stylophora pistillata]|uniref:Putative ATP-dependent RNA helicase DDX60 n=1 Tax=Stylophora pistillata TaxID=50429 RepID=A0A2B4RLM6_STYPI|nr:putative ATP-dependent RNA helicase DDX60 [Stylophora pistillata]